MSLILSQQRKNSNQEKPMVAPLPVVKASPTAEEAAAIEASLNGQPAPAPEPASAPGSVQEFVRPDVAEAEANSLPLPEAEPPPETALAEEPEETVPQEKEEELVKTPSSLLGDLEEALNFTPVAPEQPIGGGGEDALLSSVRQMPQVLRDIQDYTPDSNLYAPEIIATKKPHIYDTLNPQSTADLIKQGIAALNSAAGRRYQAQQQALEKTEQILGDRSRLLNVPRADKQWHSSPSEHSSNPWLDILFGSAQQQKESNFNPLKGEFGQAGAGVLGGLNYLLGLPLNLTFAISAEKDKKIGDWLEKLGVKREKYDELIREGITILLPEKYRFSRILGYDTEKAKKQNLIREALRGGQIADTNDPKGKNKGIFYSPRRPANVKGAPSNNPVGQFVNDILAVAKSDPLGTAIEVGTQLFNPVDNVVGDILRSALRKLGRRSLSEAAQQGSKISSGASPPPKYPPVGEAEWTPPSSPSPPSSSLSVPTSRGVPDVGVPKEPPLTMRAWLEQDLLPGNTDGRFSLPPGKQQLGQSNVKVELLPPSSSITKTSPTEIEQKLPPIEMEARLEQTALQGAPPPKQLTEGTDSSAITKTSPSDIEEKLPPIQMEARLETETDALPGTAQQGRIEGGTDSIIKASPTEVEQKLPPLQMEAWLEQNELPPTKVVRVPTNDIEVVQSALPPITKTTEGIEASTPGGLALRIGVGRASDTPIEIGSSLFLRGIDDVPGGIKAAPTSSLLEAAEQIAAHKAIIRSQLMQLDELFSTSYDFGRRYDPLSLPYSPLDSSAIMRAINNEARLNLPKQVLNQLPPAIREAVSEVDYDTLSFLLQQQRKSISEFASSLARLNNSIIETVASSSSLLKPEAKQLLTNLPTKLYHGTAIADWSPSYNLRLYGTRGELGSGLYLLEKPRTVEIYAKALVSENASALAEAKPLKPSIYELSHSFEATLNARAKIPTTSPIVEQILENIPQELKQNTLKSIRRNKTTTYNTILTKLESNIVRSGFDPSESFLKEINDTISENLRNLGFDSVYDKKSGFVMALDSTKMKVEKSKPLAKPPSAIEAVAARYNADAYAAKFYPERLTVDANLRDSAAKILNQMEATLDERLKPIVDEIIERNLFPEASQDSVVLPPKPSPQPPPPKPKAKTKKRTKSPEPAPEPSTSMKEQLSDLPNRSNSPCQP
jgi:hypothetical protein